MIPRILTALLFASAGAFAGSASAASLSCIGGNTTFTLGSATVKQCYSGNDTNTINDAFVLFEDDGFTKSDWVLSQKNDSPSDGDKTVVFSNAPMNGDQSGAWRIDDLKGLDHIVITLKAGNGFGAFLLDLTGGAPLTGTWAATKDLSHASIYYNGEVAPIPLPAAAWMFLTGLAGFFGWRRRNRKQAAATS